MPKSKARPKAKGKSKKPAKTRAQSLSRSSGAASLTPVQLRKMLLDVPGLLFEAEMGGLAMDPAALRATQAEGLGAPAAIERLTDQALLARLLICIEDIKVRAFAAQNDRLFFMADVARYYIEEFRGPPWDNPLVVALYCRSQAALAGEALSRAGIKQAVRAYEKANQAELDARWEMWEALRARA